MIAALLCLPTILMLTSICLARPSVIQSPHNHAVQDGSLCQT